MFYSKLPCYLLRMWKACGQKSEKLSNQKVAIGISHLSIKWGKSTQRFGKLAGSMDWGTVSSSLLHACLYLNTLSVVLTRYAMVGYDLQDGTHIPPGSKVTLDLRRIHFNPQIYPDPERCDLFRFSKLREKEGTDVKYGFATLDPNVGRFLSLRMVMIYLKPFVFYLSTFYLAPVRQIYRDHISCENNRNHWGWRSSRLCWSILCCRQLLMSSTLWFDDSIFIFIFKLDATQDNAILYPSPLRPRFTSWYQTASAEHYLQRIYRTQPESGARFYTEI